MKLNKGDGPKVALLVAGIVLAGGFFAKTLFGAMQPNVAPKPTSPAPQPQSAAPLLSDSQPSQAENPVASVPQPSKPGPALVNPFRKTVSDTAVTPVPARPNDNPRPLQPIATKPAQEPVLPGVRDQGFAPMNVAVAEVLPKLDGIVLGAKALAVISTSSETRFLQTGDKVGPGVTVVKIGKMAVKVSGKGKSSVWRIGDTLPTTMLH